MKLHYARCHPVTTDRAEALVAWIGESSGEIPEEVREVGRDPSGKPSTVWLLAHCDDGVTWGRWDGELDLACGRQPSLPCPLPTTGRLQQLRLFGSRGELLLWRDEGLGSLGGRSLRDHGDAESEDPLRPMDEVYLLAADRRRPGTGASGCFTAVQDRGGRTQVVPLEISAGAFAGGRFVLGLDVRHYFTGDERTGAVRIAATRLVGLRRLADDQQLAGPEDG